MSLPPDEMPIPETTNNNRLSLYEELKSATSNMHYWQTVRQQDVDATEKASRGIATADKYIAEYAKKMNAALAKLNYINAPDAEATK